MKRPLNLLNLVVGLVLALTWPLARSADHVLAITISEYKSGASVGPLAGVLADRRSALAIAERIGFDTSGAVELHDRQATLAGIRNAFERLLLAVKPNDRVFVYFSGHGGSKRISNACQSSLITHDDEDLMSMEFYGQLEQLKTRAPRQIFVMLDACHSGDFTERAARTKGQSLPQMRPKMRTLPKSGEIPCDAPINDLAAKLRASGRMRLAAKGTTNEELGGQLVMISAAQHNEVAWDSDQGGMATNALLQCLAEPKFASKEGSGYVSADALGQCAQGILNQMQSAAMRQHVEVLGHATSPLVPAWGANSNAADASQTLEAMALDSDSSWRVTIRSSVSDVWKDAIDNSFRTGPQQIGIGTASRLQVAVQSDRPGYLYLVYASRDSNQFALLYPTEREGFTAQVAAGQPFLIPRRWPARGNGGKPEQDTILAIVSELPMPQLQKYLQGGSKPATSVLSQGLAGAVSACKFLGTGEDRCPRRQGIKQLGGGEERFDATVSRFGAARFILEEH